MLNIFFFINSTPRLMYTLDHLVSHTFIPLHPLSTPLQPALARTYIDTAYYNDDVRNLYDAHSCYTRLTLHDQSRRQSRLSWSITRRGGVSSRNTRSQLSKPARCIVGRTLVLYTAETV